MSGEATAMDRSRRPTANGTDADLVPWTNGYGHMLENWTRSTADVAKCASELGRELAAFSQARLQAQSDARKALAACRNPSDLIENQRRLAETTTTQYIEETRSLAARLFGIMRDTALSFLERQSSNP